jgi:hypothetical protein
MARAGARCGPSVTSVLRGLRLEEVTPVNLGESGKPLGRLEDLRQPPP